MMWREPIQRSLALAIHARFLRLEESMAHLLKSLDKHACNEGLVEPETRLTHTFFGVPKVCLERELTCFVTQFA